MTDSPDVSEVQLIDERNAVAEIGHPRFRVTVVDGTSHATYSMSGSLAGVQAWAAANSAGRKHAIYVEVPLEGEPANVLLARLSGDYWPA